MNVAQTKPPALSILTAAENDVAIIQSLAQRIWPVCFAGILTPEQIANMLERIYAPESLRAQMQAGHRFFLAYHDAEAVGYASAYKEDGHIWLKKLYVLPSLRGQGIGTALSNAAIATFQPANDVRLLVNRGNIAACRYYERAGFTRIDEIPVMMGDFPFIDYLYSKTLLES